MKNDGNIDYLAASILLVAVVSLSQHSLSFCATINNVTVMQSPRESLFFPRELWSALKVLLLIVAH